MPLALQSRNGIHVASLSGALDNTAGIDMVTGIKASVEKGASIILDCTLVPRMDVGGFKHLLALHRWSQVGNGRLVLAGMSPEAWALIVENHCENTFESSPSVPAAFQHLGVADQPPAAGGGGGAGDYGGGYAGFDETAGYSSAGQPATDDAYAAAGYDYPAAGSTTDPWGQTAPGGHPPSGHVPQGPPAGRSPWEEAPVTDGGDPWANYDRRPGQGAAGGQGAPSGGGKSRLPLIIGLVVGLAALAGGGWWLMDFLKLPRIELEETSPQVEMVQGEEPPYVKIVVTDGVLDADDIKLPPGLSFSDVEEEEGGRNIYYLSGAPEPGARSMSVMLTASKKKGSSRKAEPVELQVEIKDQPLDWPFSPPPMVVGTEVIGYTTIVTGAKSASMTKPVPGLEVKRSAKNPEVWVLAGTPTTAGTFDIEFAATGKGGQEEKKSFPIVIAAPPPPPPPPVTVVQNPVVTDTPQGSPVAQSGAVGSTSTPVITSVPETKSAVLGGIVNRENERQPETSLDVKSARVRPGDEEPQAAAGVDDSMRAFLLERINKAGSHFSLADKVTLRMVVKNLKEAKMIAKVNFGNGEFEVSPSEKADLRKQLSETENARLLANPDCQILIVGYASTSGNRKNNIRLCQKRAKSVDEAVRDELGRGADLCGDYGPTDILSRSESENRVVEVFAGIMEISASDEELANKFKADFNRNHGAK